MRPEEERLVEVEADAAIERGIAHVGAGAARAAEEIQVMVFRIDAALFFRAVADAEIHPLVIAFGDGDARRHFGRLALGVHRFDVGKLEQLQPVQPPL